MPAALVTGAARRIGKAISLELAAARYHVVLHYNHSHIEADKLCQQIKNNGGEASIVRGELSIAEQADSLFERASEGLGTPIDVLVNNASVFEYDDVKSVDAISFDKHFYTNLYAPLSLTRQLAAGLGGAEIGNVINIIDQRVLNPGPRFTSYTLSKSALWTLTRTSAQELAPRIRVNAIAPGPVLKSSHQKIEDFEKECAELPLGQGPTPQEIAAAVLFLLDTPSVTGQMITLDGGQSLV
jgi:NAD(P)-dependent dehydrogenase (short-subunit alcohol dehydrogenase family)